jgi:Ca2+-binding RTX toxin-like protein
MASYLRRVEFALAVSVAALSCACVSIASAATVRVVDGTAIYVAAPGEANQVSVESDSLLGACSVGNLCLRDPALTQAGTGCVAGDGGATCPEDDPNAWPGHRPVRVFTLDGDDRVVEESPAHPVTLFGGTGNDSLRSGSSLGKSPVMYGGPGNDGLDVSNNGGGTPILHGGRGDDELAPHCPGVCGELYGDAGNDRLLAFASADWFDGGPGRDIYAAWSVPWDKPFADLIAPSPGIDTFDGSYYIHSPSYRIDLRACFGCVERVIGGDDEDEITGNADPQVIRGEGSDDIIRGGRGIDHLLGGDGRDSIASRDGVVDYVSCGAMEDTVIADTVDVVGRNCEHVGLR